MVIHVNPVINNFNRNLDDTEYYFHNNIPKVADPQMSIENCISILGNFDPNRFMNAFIKKIDNIDNDYIFINCSEEELKFCFYIKKEEEEGNNDDENEIKMTITLYQSNNGHILQFVRNEGTINNFNHYVQMFSGFARDLLEQ